MTAPVRALVLILCLAAHASGATITVSSFSQLVTAIGAAQPGDVILVQPGIYPVTVSRLSFYNSGTAAQPITIRGVLSGGQRPVLDAAGQDIDRGIFYIWPQDEHWVIENLEFTNSHGGASYSDNAAAAYIRGDHVTFRNCYSHHNDNGWFSTTESEDVLLEYCETAFNGTGSGYTHNHYMNSVSITLRGCYVHDSVGGINYKDRSTHTVLEGNLFVDAGGYDIDWASEGSGNALMIGNVIVRLSTAGNHKIINFGDGTGVRGGTVTLINNTIVARDDTYRVFERHSSSTVSLVLHNNVVHGSMRMFEGSSSGWSSYPTTGSSNWFPSNAASDVAADAPSLTANVFGTSPGFVAPASMDYRLTSASPCRDLGVAAPTYRNAQGNLVAARPMLQPSGLAGVELRGDDGSLDLGAFEAGPPADLSFGGSTSVSTAGPLTLGLAGDPGEVYYLLMDTQPGPGLVFPGLGGTYHLGLGANVVFVGLVPDGGVRLFTGPIPPSAAAGATVHLQSLRSTVAGGFTFSADCPAVTVVP